MFGPGFAQVSHQIMGPDEVCAIAILIASSAQGQVSFVHAGRSQPDEVRGFGDEGQIGQKEGRYNGCKTEFTFRALEVDHIILQSRGCTNHIDNLRLLCGHCDRTKGDRDQAYLVARLKETDLTS